MLFTCLGVGGIAGSLTFGRLFDKFNPLFLFVGAVSSLASITAVIPWLKKLVLMIVACAAHSFVYSGLAIGMYAHHVTNLQDLFFLRCALTCLRYPITLARQYTESVKIIYLPQNVTLVKQVIVSFTNDKMAFSDFI